ncbi:hypothetical protein EVAR_4566_1 [Eumeta japonica]|uniref:Uncharacterized protein n=1 Tax=Eumeta variegata TaxID=151549 RepID=A0A4C1SZI7_EUMVA|nr:hypothetical protein EVAR_4566_1 [Eumeta japonica]
MPSDIEPAIFMGVTLIRVSGDAGVLASFYQRGCLAHCKGHAPPVAVVMMRRLGEAARAARTGCHPFRGDTPVHPIVNCGFTKNTQLKNLNHTSTSVYPPIKIHQTVAVCVTATCIFWGDIMISARGATRASYATNPLAL